ncbi:uncharacterized protein LOC142609318 [Castanea sativa]|uniref:uncharacterized protein LOC142609318 n=1 Tax=Castanea sativa TaxID=21020 RepID=UPI003F64AD79
MVDDVINSLENMKLTAEEEEVITVSDEDRKDEIKSCSLSLIGKFLMCKPFNKRAAQITLRKAWGLDDRVQIMEVGSSMFQFKFQTGFDLERIWGAPFDMFSFKVATKVGSRMGVVEVVEKRQKQVAQSLFMRVKVSIPISKPIRRGSYIVGSDRGRTWVTFKYERLPMLCHYCSLLGHDIRHCANHYAVSKNGKEVVCQYGDWLKALGTRNGSSSKRKPN